MVRLTAANIITSGQNRDLKVCTKSEFATIIILAFLISALSCAAKMVSTFFILYRFQPAVFLDITFLIHLFRVYSFFHMT